MEEERWKIKEWEGKRKEEGGGGGKGGRGGDLEKKKAKKVDAAQMEQRARG